MLLPRTTEVQNHARMLVLVRNGMDVKLCENMMDTTVAAVWMRIGARGRRPMTLAAVYREHQFIIQDGPNDSVTPHRQLERWTKFVNVWARSVQGGDVDCSG